MYIDEYDDDFIDYDDLDDGEQYSYTNYEKESRKRKERYEKQIDDMLTSEINCEIYEDVLAKHGFDRDYIRGMSESALYDLILDNDLMDEVIEHERFNETW